MDIKFDSKEVKKVFNEIAKLGGKSKVIDTKLEKNKLSEYLANNRENMSANDISTLEGWCIEKNTAVTKQNVTVNIAVNGEGNSIQVVAGNNNVVINGDGQNSGNLAVGNNNEQNQLGAALELAKGENKEVKSEPKNATLADETLVKEKQVKEVPRDEVKLKEGESKTDEKHNVGNDGAPARGLEIKGTVVYEKNKQGHVYCELKAQGLQEIAEQFMQIFKKSGIETAIQFLRDNGVIVGEIDNF